MINLSVSSGSNIEIHIIARNIIMIMGGIESNKHVIGAITVFSWGVIALISLTAYPTINPILPPVLSICTHRIFFFHDNKFFLIKLTTGNISLTCDFVLSATKFQLCMDRIRKLWKCSADDILTSYWEVVMLRIS